MIEVRLAFGQPVVILTYPDCDHLDQVKEQFSGEELEMATCQPCV